MKITKSVSEQDILGGVWLIGGCVSEPFAHDLTRREEGQVELSWGRRLTNLAQCKPPKNPNRLSIENVGLRPALLQGIPVTPKHQRQAVPRGTENEQPRSLMGGVAENSQCLSAN